MMPVDWLLCRATARCISSAAPTLMMRTPDGGLTLVMPATHVTLAPRSCAAEASANPIRPEERFEMKRTGSIGSRVAPAVIRRRSPSISLVLTGFLGKASELFDDRLEH